MTSKFMVIGKFIAIALAAATAAWVFIAVLFRINGSEYEYDAVLTGGIQIALLGSYVVGLPVALLIYSLAREQLIRTPSVLLLITGLAGVMMMLACFALGDLSVVLLFGLPSFIAAITFGALGWLWILKPQREKLSD